VLRKRHIVNRAGLECGQVMEAGKLLDGTEKTPNEKKVRRLLEAGKGLVEGIRGEGE